MTLADLERKAIIEALSFFSGNQTKAAKALGISQRGMRYKIRDIRDDKVLRDRFILEIADEI